MLQLDSDAASAGGSAEEAEVAVGDAICAANRTPNKRTSLLTRGGLGSGLEEEEEEEEEEREEGEKDGRRLTGCLMSAKKDFDKCEIIFLILTVSWKQKTEKG